jgi:acyl-CoA synthetase (AMP-forming)/AMP-acid ligase II
MPHFDALKNWPVDRGFLSIGRSLAINARRFPEKVALSEVNRSITYWELNQKVNRLVYGLKEVGVEEGDHVAILFGNTIEHMLVLHAVAKLGAISVVLDIKWKEREVTQALNVFDCDLLLFDSTYHSNVSAEALRDLKHGGFPLGEDGSFSLRLEELMNRRPTKEPHSPARDEDVFMIMLTAGTTGTPKGCLVNHKTYAIHCLNSAVGRGCDENSKELSVVPIYYNSGRGTVLAHLFFGGTVYLRNKFDPGETMEIVQNEKITSLALASTMCHRLLQLSGLGCYRTESIKSLRKAGLPFTRKMVEELIRYVTPNIYQGYASTDAGQATLLRPHEQLLKIGSSGRPIWGVEVDVVDDNHDSLPSGREGEIRVRGPNVCQGYYKNPEEERKRFIDGWYYTGDIGCFDSDGYLYVVGRKRDIIKTGSINVAPKEIEEILLLHPNVADAAVVGIADPEWGEVIKAYIVPQRQEVPGEMEIIKFCKGYLADYKVPKRIEFVKDLNRNELGKVTFRFLEERELK